MKKKIFIVLLFASLIGLSEKSTAQVTKDVSQTREQRDYYRKTLQIDSVKAEQVAQIQVDYKKGLALVVGDSSLTDGGRRAKIELLIAEKNRRLKGILAPSLLQKVIPTTEREVPKTAKQL